MHLDVIDLRDFYATPLGLAVWRSVHTALGKLGGTVERSIVIGFGFATPYLSGYRHAAERVLAFMPAEQGVMDWPSEGGSATALVEEQALPLPDACVDHVLLVHAIEMSSQPQALMTEIRRVLAASGRLVAVVPNRQGAWARSDVSPFGFGHPYSRGQLRHLLTDAGFEAEAWETALHMPPSARRTMLGLARPLDRIGSWMWPAFSGVIAVRATKRTVQGVPARTKPRLAPAMRPVLRPAGVAGRSRA